MKINPISFNVIRQSLRWANIPTPRLFRDGDAKRNVDGTLTAIYGAEFTREQVDNWNSLFSNYARSMWYFQQAIAHSFCEDITTLDRVVDLKAGTVTVFLYVRLTKKGG